MSFKQTAIKAAKEAGKILMRNFGKLHKARSKAKHSIVTKADLDSERKIIEIIKSKYPSHDILTEEQKQPKSKSDYLWIIDPLDGTNAYASGYPSFAISIALAFKGKVILGVVYNPILNELFLAEENKKALLNNKSISVSSVSSLNEMLIGTAIPYENEEATLKHLKRLVGKVRDILSGGSSALELCYVACGRLGVYFHPGLKPWDMAAAYVIIKEAGGKMTELKGNPWTLDSKDVLATNRKIHRRMLNIIKSV